jgi:release factor glutamine methyltransferase
LTVAEILKTIPRKKQGDALWLLESILGKNRNELLLNARDPLAPVQLKLWKKYWRARLAGKPMQYIVGRAPFWGRELRVGKGVLIPRPETEVLVELCLKLFPEQEEVRALDIGTGSGAIAITLKLENPHWEITATDISVKALDFARQNAEELGADLNFVRADLFAPGLRQPAWDLVVSNPPYLDFKKDSVTAEVKKWEPHSALEPGEAARAANTDRAAWCGENILAACAAARPRYTVMELSARVASLLERRWRRHPGVKRIWREPDLAGKKRFLLVAWSPHA